MLSICKMLSLVRAAVLGAGVAAACAPAFAATVPASAGNDGPVYGPRLEGFTYPEPVHRYAFVSQRETLEMMYLDVQPAHPNGRTVVLLHGKNFCAGTWEDTIGVLSRAGYRVVAPDQIGFCKSSKPDRYQYSFQQLAHNTHALLESIGDVELGVLSLGQAVYDEMTADGVPGPHLETCALYALYYWSLGEDAADAIFEAQAGGGASGGATGPSTSPRGPRTESANRTQRRASSRATRASRTR